MFAYVLAVVVLLDYFRKTQVLTDSFGNPFVRTLVWAGLMAVAPLTVSVGAIVASFAFFAHVIGVVALALVDVVWGLGQSLGYTTTEN